MNIITAGVLISAVLSVIFIENETVGICITCIVRLFCFIEDSNSSKNVTVYVYIFARRN